MHEPIIMNVRVVGVPNIGAAEEQGLASAYSNAITDHFFGDLEAINRCMSAAHRMLMVVEVYPSDILESDRVIAEWENANLCGIEAAFKGMGNTGCAHFEIEFWAA
jgi:hypothetical protein